MRENARKMKFDNIKLKNSKNVLTNLIICITIGKVD